MRTTNYQKDLLQRLSNSHYAAEYLNAAWEKTTQDGNMEAFWLALRNVVDATGSVPEVSTEADASRQHLHQVLSGTGEPTLKTLNSVLKAVGLSIDFKPTPES